MKIPSKRTKSVRPRTLKPARAGVKKVRWPRGRRTARPEPASASPEVTLPSITAPDGTPSTSPAAPQGDILSLYLREIGQVRLITPEEEIALASRIRKGDRRAREEMIKANLRLVVKIARDYEGYGLPLLDLISEGNIGLMKGVERFDPRKGAKLSTYASWWIKQAIKRALANQSKTIRLPVHVVDKMSHIRRADVRLREILGREATDEEVAHDLGLNPQRVSEYREAARAPVSLNSPIGDDESNSVFEVVADPNAVGPLDELVRRTDTDLLREILATLDQRETAILSMRFGLDGDEPKTLEEVGERFKVTRERIRQIQELALKKMRAAIEKRDAPAEELAA